MEATVSVRVWVHTKKHICNNKSFFFSFFEKKKEISFFPGEPYKQCVSVLSYWWKEEWRRIANMKAWNKWMTFVSRTQTMAIHSWTEIIRVLVHTAIKRLPVINTSPLHMQSTHGATHNNPASKREGRLVEKKKKKDTNEKKNPERWTFLYITDSAETMFCFAAISYYFYQPPAWVRQWCGGREGRWGGGGRRARTFWKPLSHSLEWWHGSNETEERDTVL